MVCFDVVKLTLDSRYLRRMDKQAKGVGPSERNRRLLYSTVTLCSHLTE